ncbi:hypothetical protein D3C76_1224830 [compost metagenome]
MAEWKVRTHCRAWAASKGNCQKPSTFTSCSRSCAQEALVKEITVSLPGSMPRWQSMNTTRSTRVVDLPEPAPAKMRVSGWRQRIIAHCSSDGMAITPAATAWATRSRMAATCASSTFIAVAA